MPLWGNNGGKDFMKVYKQNTAYNSSQGSAVFVETESLVTSLGTTLGKDKQTCGFIAEEKLSEVYR
jgi:hypothetical protein